MQQQPLEDWIPQDEFLGIIGTGDGWAVASKGGMGIEGHEMWTLKDSIGRTWMNKLHELPDMETMIAEKVIVVNVTTVINKVYQYGEFLSNIFLFRREKMTTRKDFDCLRRVYCPIP